jgi:hypothetical protein
LHHKQSFYGSGRENLFLKVVSFYEKKPMRSLFAKHTNTNRITVVYYDNTVFLLLLQDVKCVK